MTKMNPSISIINLQYVDNYGCVLGAYALQQEVQKLGFGNVELIDNRIAETDNALTAKLHRVAILCRTHGLIETCRFYMSVRKQSKYTNIETYGGEKRRDRFEIFRSLYLKRSVVCKITCEDAPPYDIYIVGSDVVWLLHDLCLGFSPGFLKFTKGKECRRIAYAASMGDTPYEVGRRRVVKKLYRNGLKDFDMVSVREKTSAEYLAPLYSGKIYCCMDPTLLLDVSDYDSLFHGCDKANIHGYIYVYMLNSTDQLCEYVNRISAATGLKVVRCCDQPAGYENVIAEAEMDGPLEFLDRVKNADLVITNSFHAICFSVLYHKNFWAVKRVIQAYKTEELLKRLGLTGRYLDPEKPDRDVLETIDYHSVDIKLKKWRENSIDFLKTAFGIKREE